MITDFKGRQYRLIGIDSCFTRMECMETGDLIKVANQWFTACGFRSA